LAISSSTRKAGPFLGNDATTVFPFAFKVFTSADLRVVRTNALGVESDLVLDTDYTVALNSNQDNDPGGTVTRATALPTGERLTITSDVEALQPLVLTNNGGFYPRVINDAFDKITIIAQQLIEQVGRSLKLPISSSASATLPDPVANSLIAWNSSANGFANVAPASVATLAAFADAYIDLFTGNGTQTVFTLTHAPVVLANLSVSISGVVQVGGEDFTSLSNTITFTTAPPNGTRIQVRYSRALPPSEIGFLSSSSGAAAVGTAASGTGAVTRTVEAKLRDTVSAFDYIPVAEHAAIVAGTSTYNASADVQKAIDTGKTVEFPEGFYQVVGLTMSTNGQRLVALGYVNLQKRANGVILTASANNIELNGITFRGDSGTPTFTGDNISLTGDAPRIINCGSMWAYGRALKATGNNAVVQGSNPIWQTADATGTGFDIEIGVSGTATLYHYLQDVYTSQATGGILLTDTGSHAIVGGQFGKYSILSGTSPAGVNAGTTVGSRIIGTVQIGLSNGLFSAVAFSSITLTCLSGTSGISIDRSNTFASGATVVNNGNASNVIQLDGAVGGYQSTKFGGTTSLAVQAWDPATGNMLMPNGDILINGTDKGIRLSNNGHGLLPSGNNLALANTLGSTQVIPAGTLQLGGTNTNSVDINATGLLLLSGKALYNNSIKVVGAQGAAVADAAGGIVVDVEARAALNALLARLRTHGLIAT
jgi:hypothetical protein